jgi:FMN-dependent NADH-azoreductase
MVEVKKKGNSFRLVEKGTAKLARTETNKVARDGGGHRSKAAAERQASYINSAMRKKGYN